MQPTTTLAYPFFTRFADGDLYKAYFSDTVLCEVIAPADYYPEGKIEWRRTKRAAISGPRLVPDELSQYVDTFVTREEFMAAYQQAEAFLQAAEREFLPVKPVEFITSEQSAEIKRLLNHPAFSRPAKTKWLLRINRLTRADAVEAIRVINETRAMFDQPDRPVGTFGMVSEVFHVKAVAA